MSITSNLLAFNILIINLMIMLMILWVWGDLISLSMIRWLVVIKCVLGNEVGVGGFWGAISSGIS